MKKKLFVLLGIFTVIIIASVAVSKLAKPHKIKDGNQDKVIVTSFYPMYILTTNNKK